MQSLISMLGAIALLSFASFSNGQVQDGCLTPAQDSDLKKAITGIQITLTATYTALEIAADAEKNPTTKHDLQIAAQVIRAVNTDLVANLSKILEEPCGTCKQIAEVVNQTVVALEQTLSQIDPDWRNSTIWKVVVTAVNDILAIVEIVCPSAYKALHRFPMVKTSCLNASQIDELKKVTAGIQIVLVSLDTALDIAVAAESDPTTKKDLEIAERVVHALSVDLVANLTKIAESPCGTCTEIVDTVDYAIHVLENTLANIDPDWQNNPIWKAVVSAIDEIAGYIKQLCPSKVGAPFW